MPALSSGAMRPPPSPTPSASCASSLAQLQAQRPAGDLWVFAYASLIWRPEFDAVQALPTRVHGWHRALKMWSRINRGSPECPGLVFALLRGGSCAGMVYRVASAQANEVLERLWAREMPMAVYEPRWLACPTREGTVRALAFTLPLHSPSHTGPLSAAQLRHIFAHARGRFGSTREYAEQTLQALRALGIEDRALARLIGVANSPGPQRNTLLA